ncbi:cardiolipin synthase [Atopococcus tabaci]|uniref:cardiolipin synthase n=1 Tax=Atopococcus tabaci TaxID=269774 RepID=UPI002409282D|nr:cardiolipin synthase [Atopococcus tabaci]
MEIVRNIVIFILVVNTILAIITVFREKRDIAATWAWLLVLNLLPVIGFILYLFIGRKISKEQIFDIRTQETIGMPELVEAQQQLIAEDAPVLDESIDAPKTRELASLFLETTGSVLTKGNKVSIIADGEEKFDRLIEDISKAQHHVHVMYYIFKMDKIGSRLLEALKERAANGVEVAVLFDSFGSRTLRSRSFKRLRELGGYAEPSFKSKFPLLNLRLNFRNHRKIVVIDGKVGYTGGFNVGDDYLGEYENMGYWRDTHLRIEGNGVLPLQTRFIMDWNASVKHHKLTYYNEYFPISPLKGTTDMQVVASGPDTEIQAIKKGFLKMIYMAEESVYIQTPYFVPDEGVMEALEIALFSGVDVKIMIPNKPDHPFIYRATLYYASELARLGAEIYIYDKGFLHSKAIVIDRKLCSIGSANFDIRSFKLNFENNVFLYDEQLAQEQEALFFKDVEGSYLLTDEIMANFSLWERFKQTFSRLLSPIL